jgi:bla regulator protein BlaR1
MIAEIARHLWQSTFCVAAVAGLTLAFRGNRAHVRYWLWLCASAKFLIPFALLISLGTGLEAWMPARRIASQAAIAAVSYTFQQVSEPLFAASQPVAHAVPGAFQWAPFAMLAVWFGGFAAVVIVRFRNWFRVRNAVRLSTLVDVAEGTEVRVSPCLLEPGVVGLLHPVILLPEGIASRLSPSELKAVLAHELCHIRRRDNLFAAIHMTVEAIVWFNPVIWWIGARLIEERERACDEAVLGQGNRPDIYADAILSVCKLYVESPLACAAGVSGAGIRRRIEAIMANRRLRGLNRAKKFLLAGVGIAALAGPILAGLLIAVGNVPEIYAQTHAPKAPAQKFEAASIRPCDANMAARGGRGSNRGERGGLGNAWSPGRITRTCVTAMTLVQDAYVRYADGKTEPTFALRMPPISGAPSWVTSDLYTIDAKAEGLASRPAMFGPMLQSLLADRFGLKLHYETKIVPTYELTAAKGGSKLRPTLVEAGKCDIVLPPGMNFKGRDGKTLPGFGADGRFKTGLPPAGQPCQFMVTLKHGPNNFLVGKALGLDELTNYLVNSTGRPVIDKTGFTGKFDVVLEFAPDETAGEPSAASSSDMPGLVTAIEQQLGLKLVSSKGPRNFMVIDHIDRPSEN